MGEIEHQAGWYPDPDNPGALRWWDGTAWSETRRAGGSSGASAAPSAQAPHSATASFVEPTALPETRTEEPVSSAPPWQPPVENAVQVRDTWSGERVSTGTGDDMTAWASFLLALALVPVSWFCLSPFAWAVSLLLPVGPTIVAVGYLAAVVLLLIPAVERQTSMFLFGSREPTALESERLDPAWADVISRVAEQSREFILRVVDSDELNAMAAGGHIVAVTRAALELPDMELRAVLAHELGHHTGLHAIAGLLTFWLLLPIAWVIRIATWIASFCVGMIERSEDDGIPWISLLIGAVAAFVSLVLRAFSFVVDAVLRFFGRQAEFVADGMAVNVGFGPALISAFHRMRMLAPDDGIITVSERLASTHPDFGSRIERIEVRLNEIAPGWNGLEEDR